MRADIMQWDMQMDSLEVAEATNWLGSTTGPCDVNGWRATRFDIKGSIGLAMRKKGNRRNEMTFQEYFGMALPAQACLPELRATFEAQGTLQQADRQLSKSSEWSESSESISGFDLTQAGAFDFLDAEETASIHSEVLTDWPDAQATPAVPRDTRECKKLQSTPPGQALEPRASASFGVPATSNASAIAAESSKKAQEKKKKPEATKKQPPTRDQTGKTTKAVSASVWFANDFPVPLQQFLSILDVLATEHEAIRSLKQLLDSESLKNAARRVTEPPGRGSTENAERSHVFPVRASVPLNLALRATVHFESFTLQSPGALPAELFEVPVGYKLVPRREAQKTPNRAKKRMLLANLTM